MDCIRFTHIDGLEIVKDALPLMDDRDGQFAILVSRSAKLVPRFNAKTMAQLRRDCHHPGRSPWFLRPPLS